MEIVKPVRYGDLLDEIGEPGDMTDFIKAPFPFTMYLNGNKNQECRNFYGHKRIYPAVFDAFSEIMDIFGLDFIRKHGLDNYGGCYALRPVRGGARMSDHSWGMAVDLEPHLGQLGKPSLIPYHIVQAFINRGFIWGGNYERPDGMHFTAVKE
jgi:hypothetical protein